METDRKKTASEELSRKARLSEWLHDSNQAKDSIPEDTPPLYVALSDPEPSESHQTNHSHLSSENCDNTSNYGAHPDGLISELFRNSQKAWKLVIDKLAAGLHGTIDFTALQAFRTEAGRFNVWDDGFEAGNGGLGEVLDGAETMKEAVIFLGASIAQKLLRYLPVGTLCCQELSASLEKACYQFPETVSPTDDDYFDGKLSTTIFELSNLNDCLFDLAPSLEAVPISIDDGDIEPDNADVISINALQDEESPYLANVRDKFPKACASLAKDLAKLNWDRHVRIRDMRTRWENSQVQSELDTHRDQDTVGIQTSHAKDSGYQTMSLALSAALQSQSQIVKPRQTPSIMSFGATTNAEQVGRTRYPPPPVKLDPESGCFQCNICYRTLDGINSKLQWRKHIIRDIQPYNCSFPNCSTRTTSYSSRKAWLDHEFSCHRFSNEWVCIPGCGEVFEDKIKFHTHLRDEHRVGPTELNGISNRCHFQKAPPPSKKTTCPLCAEEIQETRLFLRRHIGHHLEEIALAALPPDIYQLGDEVENSSADSQTSPVHGMENNNANRLAPPVNVMENSDVESLVTSTHGVENSSANLPPPLQPPLVLSYEPTGDEALAEKIDYLGNILDGTSSVGRVAGSVENSSVKPPSPLQPPLVLSYEPARHEALAERIDYLGNILDGTSSVGRVAGSVENSSVKPPSPLQPPLALSYEPAGHEALAERIGYLGNILDDSSTPQGGYQLPSQYQELKVPVSSTTESVFDQFLRLQQSWNHGGLLSYTSLPSQAPPPTGPPSVTHSMQHSPLHHQPKSKRSRPSKSQPLNEAVARSKASSNEAVAGSEVDSNEAVVGSVVGSDRTCHTCTIEFRFPCDLKIHNMAKHNGGVQCPICHESLSTEYSRNRHLATKHGQGLPCKYEGCNALFGTEPALNNHLAKEHRVGTQCKECGAIVPSNKFDRHMSDKHNQVDYPCNLCGKRLTSDTNLRAHRKNCRRLEPPPQGHHHRGGDDQ